MIVNRINLTKKIKYGRLTGMLNQLGIDYNSMDLLVIVAEGSR